MRVNPAERGGDPAGAGELDADCKRAPSRADQRGLPNQKTFTDTILVREDQFMDPSSFDENQTEAMTLKDPQNIMDLENGNEHFSSS